MSTTSQPQQTQIETIRRLKKEKSVLKKAVLSSQQSRQELQGSMHSLSKSKRRLEAEIQSHQEEIDRLGFSNEQLKRRITQMIRDFKEQEEERSASVSSNSTMLGRLLGSGASEETEKLQEKFVVLQEELNIKISENECVLMKQFELQKEHEEQVIVLRKEVLKSKQKYQEINRELISEQRISEKLISEKQDTTKKSREATGTFEAARASMNQRYRDMANVNAELNKELDTTRKRLRDKVPFDDGSRKWWNAWTLPPHDHTKEKALVCGCIRGILALQDLMETYASCCDVASSLLRIRLHHVSDSKVVIENEKEKNIRETEARVREKMFTKMATATRSFIASSLSSSRSPSFPTPSSSPSSSSPSSPSSSPSSSLTEKEVVNVVNNNNIRLILEMHEQLTRRITTDKTSKETIVSHAVHKSIQALFSLLLIRWNNSSFTTTSSALVKDILGQEENVKSCLRTKEWKIILTWVVQIAREAPSFVQQISTMVDNVSSALREHATVVAQRIAEEQRRPFVSKSVRTALRRAQDNEFKVATSGERFAEAIRYVEQTSQKGNNRSRNGRSDRSDRNGINNGNSNSNNNDNNNNATTSFNEIHNRDAIVQEFQLKENMEEEKKSLEMASLLQQMRGTLSTKAKSYHEWIRSKKLIAALPHLSAVKFRDDLELSRKETNELRVRTKNVEIENETLKETANQLNLKYNETVQNLQNERNLARDELKRIQEESAVALLSSNETERHLRSQLSLLQKDNKEHGTVQFQMNSTLKQNNTDNNNFTLQTKSNTNTNTTIEQEEARPHSHAHTHRSGTAKYTLHVLDYDGVVRGLNTLRVSNKESTREEKIRLYYENQLQVRDAQIGNADAVATKFHDKYHAALSKLKSVIKSTQRHDRSLRDGSARVKRAKEELQATREAMAAQSAMLTQRVMELEEQFSDANVLVDRLQNNEVRCVHCHGWNRIGRIVSDPNGALKPCIHCRKNSGFRSLVE